MNINECTNIEELKPIAESWLAEADLESFHIEADLKRLAEDMTEWMKAEGAVFTAEVNGFKVGMIAVFAVPSYIGPQKFAIEKYWYCMRQFPMCAAALYVRALEWATEHGCSHIIASISQTSDRWKTAARFFESMNAKPFEQSYIMELN